LTDEIEENRRALMQLYSVYTLQNAAFALTLALSVLADFSILASRPIPLLSDIALALIFATPIPTILALGSTIYWGKVTGYAMTVPPKLGVNRQRDLLEEMHTYYASVHFDNDTNVSNGIRSLIILRNRLSVSQIAMLGGVLFALFLLLLFVLQPYTPLLSTH